MIIKYPAVFLLLVPVIIFYLLTLRAGNSFMVLPVFKHGKAAVLSSFASVMYFLSLLLIITALSAPSFRTEKTRYLSPGENYFFILDISPSMSVKDIDSIKRIDAAKKVIKKFRAARANDYPGLILFSDKAFLAVPPSPDINYFDSALENADIIYPDKGTAIGDAVGLAVYYLKKANSENRIAVLVSDGISNTGFISPLSAAKEAVKNNIRIYTVCAGSNAVNSTENTLEMIATETGALYFRGESINELEHAFSFISSVEERERIAEKVIKLENFSNVFIKAALILLFISFFIKAVVLKEISL